MDKIKGMLSGNKDENVAASDRTTTGQTSALHSGTTGTQTTGLTGEGSHLASARDTAGSENASGLTPQNTTTSGIGNTQTTGLSSGRATSGVGNTQTTGLPSETTTAGPHDSDLANKADPRFDSDDGVPRTAGGGVANTSSIGTHDGSTGHHFARDSAVGAGGVGLAEHEHHKHQNDGTTGIGGTSGTTGLGQSTGVHDTTTGSTGHHLGRDAAVGAGGAGLAEHEHHKHQQEHQTGIGSTTGTTSLGQSTGTHDTTTGSTEHHLGRDAAGGAGGAGLAKHEHRKHESERESGLGSTAGQSTGAYDNTTGSSTTGTGHQSHVGRDAGLGAAGLGAAGVAEHEHHKHEQGTTSDLPGPAPNTAGPHKKDWMNKLDPRVDANPDQPQSTGHGPLKVEEGKTGTAAPYDPTTGYVSNPHHHGVTDVNPDGSTTRTANPTHHGQTRENVLPGHDAAAVGALGGAGAYEAGKYHGAESGIGGTSSTTTGAPHSSKLANKADPSVDTNPSKVHNYGTNAGIAGGAGATAYEADKHHKHDKDLTAAEREEKKEHKRELKEEKREHKEEKHEHKESKGGLLSFLHRDKNKKYTPEEEAEFDRQEREHNSSHKGRDALGGAAVGGAAYEAEKHHHDHKHAAEGDTNKALPTAPGNHGIGTGAGTGNALAGDNTTSTSSGHLGKDAALAGGVGAVGAHEHSKHSGTSGATGTQLAEKPVGKDLGDKLHGVERNRGVAGSSGFPDSEGFGTGVPSSAGIGSTTTTGHDSHVGRDVGLGAGAVGGAGLAEHEHRKHEGATGGQYDNTTSTSSGLTGSHHGQDTSATGHQSSHVGRDTALGAGGVGLAEHEHRKHEGHHDTTSGLTGSQQGVGGSEYRKDGLGGDEYGTGQQSGLTGQQASAVTGTGSSYDHNVTSSGITGPGNPTDRNRLHKDPPAGHPAAQGGVPASSSERERMVGQGEQSLDQDTGVANAHGQGGVNAASNY